MIQAKVKMARKSEPPILGNAMKKIHLVIFMVVRMSILYLLLYWIWR